EILQRRLNLRDGAPGKNRTCCLLLRKLGALGQGATSYSANTLDPSITQPCCACSPLAKPESSKVGELERPTDCISDRSGSRLATCSLTDVLEELRARP